VTIDLEVSLHGLRIGTLTMDERGEKSLRFSQDYRERAERPVLGQKFEDDLQRTYRGKRGSLPPFFANLIPERSGELRPLLEQQLEVAPDDDFALLEVLGCDLPGAVEVRRVSATRPRLAPANDDEILPTIPHNRDEESMRFSLAGVQLKFSVILARDKVTLPAHGTLGNWLVKLDSERFPRLCENEYAMMRWAKLGGFDVPDCLLMPSEVLLGKLSDHAVPDTHVLAVRRYDRNGTKIHQEDFAQVVNLLPEHKYDHVSYEQLTKLVGASVGVEAQDEVLRRLAFMIASGNADAHLKNWSLVYPDRIHARLGPLYDQVATIAWPGIQPKLALEFGGVKLMAQLDHDKLARFADKSGLDRARVKARFDETFERLAAAWTRVLRTSEWSLPTAHADALREYWQRIPMLRHSPLGQL
jgi:serine/threonine-protein kinase HipA